MSQHFHANQLRAKILGKNTCLSQTSKAGDFVGSQISKSKKKNNKMEFIKTNHQQVDAARIHERLNTGQEVSHASRVQRL